MKKEELGKGNVDLPFIEPSAILHVSELQMKDFKSFLMRERNHEPDSESSEPVLVMPDDTQAKTRSESM